MSEARVSIGIDPDVARAATLPASFYKDPELWERTKERIFARAWLMAPDLPSLEAKADADRPEHSAVLPFTLLPGFLDEPLFLSRQLDGTVRCLTNVCTHRGTVLVPEAACVKKLRCRYHGRKFDLSGAFLSMPGFEGVEGFPAPSDSLTKVALARFGPMQFTSLDPEIPFDALIAPVKERLGFFPVDDLVLDRGASRDYTVRAHWVLYCDNYLEGFHIAYVHPALADILDVSAYRYELFEHGNLQIGVASEGDEVFGLPNGHPDHGQRIAGYYFWLFPATMLNFYPWGISVNLVEPVSLTETRVRFLIYVLRGARRDAGAGADLHRVEMEDEGVVEAVQRGIASRFYRRGRYSPSQERCVHHFHQLLTARLA